MDLAGALKKHFGYETFRPLQREIISDALAGRDVFVLMPTGGGKSLCFQLPALVRDGLTIVVSPLISLMKDQVDALQTSGITATYLNSTLNRQEASARWRGLHRGEYRMLYVAPERLMLDTFLESALNWNIAQIAIDEAHCISEWGHDFRPEYRELKKLRTHFPDVPVMALTATATERVRIDIVKQLKLREPRCYVASFNRPNLNYRVVPKSAPYEQLLAFIRSRANESGIVYCASRKGADSLAVRLGEDGITAKPYHAGLTTKERTRNQELFLRDDARVITATIAFGMGINKPNVRFVVHYDLPKNLESYYQETGRAGRDGLPSECVLLFSPSDVAKQLHFIDEKSESEARIAREQLRQMVHYAETRECRRATLLKYFGEQFSPQSCDGCDNCLQPRETFDGTLPAQKFLSCVHRIHRKSGFGFGVNHIVEVLTGADTQAIRQRHHNELSTYGIGRELKRDAWQAIGRELLRLGLIECAPGKFATLTLTHAGVEALRQRTPITLTKQIEIADKPKKARAGAIECDELLFERLRVLRRKLADERDVPAYVIFSDVSLREMARNYPATAGEFRRIPGVGEQKFKDFAEPFFIEIKDYLANNSRRTFSDDVDPLFPQHRPGLNDSQAETLRRFRKGESVDEIARARGFVRSTIYAHLVAAIECGKIGPQSRDRFFISAQEKEIAAAFRQVIDGKLTDISALLGGKYDIGELRVFRAFAAKRFGRALPMNA
ncbi:MAG TPA: DNA helicase RecQ [Candidatus Udaeobacter sp.]|jgi:ATP-dependent DNA helicase RecQ|nr:DNA helicase RecQ [Candidatus Udaeobacter sp.]